MKTYVFDLDHTICIPNLGCTDVHERYAKAEPIEEMILLMQELKRAGHWIIIHTARRMLTQKGNVEAIVAEVGDITRIWLEENKVPFDELIFGKPYGDFYIDDKAIRPTELFPSEFPAY